MGDNMQTKNNRMGSLKYLYTHMEVADSYHSIALNNHKSADILLKQGLYNEAAYMYIQAMEKYVDEQICRRVDVINSFYSKQFHNIGHRLDKSIEFLIEIYSGSNITLKEQLKSQLIQNILKGLKFSSIHNNLRYPYYNDKKNDYCFLTYSQKDCIELQQMTDRLIKFLKEIYIRL